MAEQTLTPTDSTPLSHAAPLTPRRLLRSVLTVMIGFAATKMISLIQVVLIADRFDIGEDYDTFAIGNNVTTQLIRILGAGAITVAFIPVFSGLLNRQNADGAWQLASQIFNTLLIITIAAGLIIGISAPLLVEYILAPGFSDSQVAQTSALIRILLTSVTIFSLSSLFTGVLHGHNHFLLPVLAPIFYDIGLLFGIIFFTGPWGVYGLAWGTVLGASLHLGIQIPGVLLFKAQWKPKLGWNNLEFRMVLRLIAPRIMSSVIFAINIVAIGSIATELGTGSASAFEWGIRIMDIPEALIGTAIGLVLLPTLSALSELKKIDERRQIFSEALRFICVAAIPAAAGMMLIGKPALYTLFPEERTVQVETVDESNEQTDFETSSATTQENSEDEDEEATASADLIYAVVQILAFAVIFQSLHEIVTRAFYAEKDTWIPLLASFWGMIGNFLVLGIGFGLYRNLDLPLAGPLGVGLTGLGYTVSFLIELAFLIMVLRNRWNDIDAPRILNTVSLTLIATFIMAIPVFGIDYFLARNIFTEGTRVAGILRAGIGTLVGGVVFLGAALWLDLHEIKQLPKLFRRSRQAETVL